MVVPCRVGAHPRGDGFGHGVRSGVGEIAALRREAVQGSAGEFHVVVPVVLLIEIGRRARGRLRRSRMGGGVVVGLRGTPCKVGGEGRVAVGKDAAAQGKGRGELRHRRRLARAVVLVFHKAVGLARHGIYRPSGAGAVAVVGAVGLRHAHIAMVAVVGYLIEIHVLLGIHALHPFQPPAGLVEDVGRSVGAGHTARVELVGPHIGRGAVGVEELVYGVGRGGEVLEIVGSVVPTAAHVVVAPVGLARKHQPTVVLMAFGLVHGVVAAALLAQIVQRQFVDAQAAVSVVADVERGNVGHLPCGGVARGERIGARFGGGGEVYSCGGGEGCPRRHGHNAVDGAGAAVGRHEVEGEAVDGHWSDVYGAFEVIGAIAGLVDS